MKSSEFLNDVSHRQKNSLLELVEDRQLNNYLELSFSTIEQFIDSIPQDDDFNVNDDTLPSQILMELSQIVNNSAKACLLLNMTNLEFQSFVLLRDLLELDLLMNYFLIYPNEIKMWWETYDENRLKKYAPVKLRNAIGDANRVDTFTGKLATVKKNGSPHVVPIWFVVEVNSRNRNRNKVGNIYFTTGRDSVKAKNIQRDSRVSICVDDQTPPFSFVSICGNAKLIPYRQKEVLKWATKIAERYMGKKNAKAYGERNSGEDEVLVRIRPTKIIAEKDVAI